MHTVSELEAFFFRAMLAGYVASASKKTKKTTIPELPGSKKIVHQEEDLKLVDFYFVSAKSYHSYGTTIIYDQGVPVWMMQYGGWYFQEAIPVLKQALRSAYGKSHFFGGRGPAKFSLKEFRATYRNDIHRSSSFRKFSGNEEILMVPAGAILPHRYGSHQYFGGVMPWNK